MTEHKKATNISATQDVAIASVSDDIVQSSGTVHYKAGMRVVATSKTQGVVQMRYAPIDPQSHRQATSR